LLSAITDFPLPAGEGASGSLTVGPDGNLWFPGGGEIGRITPAGAFSQFPLPAGEGASGSLTVGPDGNLWFPESGAPSAAADAIGRITPAGAITQFLLPTVGLHPRSLVVGPDGNLWFPEYAISSGVPGKIGRITPSGTITDFPLPTDLAPPTDLTVGPDGNLWFPGGGEISRITPAGAITQFPLPTGGTSVIGLTVGPDGNLWFPEDYPFIIDGSSPPGKIGRITPAGALTQFPLPAGDGSPGDLTVGPDGNLWFPENFGAINGFIPPSYIGRITPAGAVTEFPYDIFPGDLTVGPDGNLWFPENFPQYEPEYIQPAIGRITPAGALTEFPLPASYGALGDLTLGPDGNLWFPNSGSGSISRLDPTALRATGVIAVADSRGAITSILLGFGEALDPGKARNRRFYHLAAGRVLDGSIPRINFGPGVKIARVSYDRTEHAVRLKLAVPQKRPVQVTVGAGLVAAHGIASFSGFTAVVT
jgi:streptogramin lyase